MSPFHRILSAALQLKSAAWLMYPRGKENERKEVATKLINASLSTLLPKGQGQRERSDLLGRYKWMALEYPKKALSILRYVRAVICETYIACSKDSEQSSPRWNMSTAYRPEFRRRKPDTLNPKNLIFSILTQEQLTEALDEVCIYIYMYMSQHHRMHLQ